MTIKPRQTGRWRRNRATITYTSICVTLCRHRLNILGRLIQTLPSLKGKTRRFSSRAHDDWNNFGRDATS